MVGIVRYCECSFNVPMIRIEQQQIVVEEEVKSALVKMKCYRVYPKVPISHGCIVPSKSY